MYRVCLAVCSLIAATSVHAASSSVFFEDFSSEAAQIDVTAPKGQINFTGFDQLSIADGSVDLFADGQWGLECLSGGCLDLDGSTSNAARLETTSISFAADKSYTIEIVVSGNQRQHVTWNNGAAANPDTLSFGIGSQTFGEFTLAPEEGFRTVALLTDYVFATATTDYLFLDHAGADYFGMILDSILVTENDTQSTVLSEVEIVPNPLPAGLPLMLAGIGSLAYLRKRKKS